MKSQALDDAVSVALDHLGGAAQVLLVLAVCHVVGGWLLSLGG